VDKHRGPFAIVSPGLIDVRGDEADDRSVCLERGLTPALPAFVSLRLTQAPAVLDHTGVLPQRDRRVGPALDRCSVGRHRQGVVLDAGQVSDDGLAVRSVYVSMRNVKCVRVFSVFFIAIVPSPNPPRPRASPRAHPGS
jgi:hypothetical protein